MSVDWSINERPNPEEGQNINNERQADDGGQPNNDNPEQKNKDNKERDDRRPSNDGERRPNDGGKRPSNDGRRSNDDGRRQNNDGRRSNDGERRPNNDGRRPNDEPDDNEANDDNSSLEMDDETLSERLLGLTEMFPEPVTEVIDHMAEFLHSNFKKVYWFSTQSTWIVETCTLILLGPILLSYCGWKRDAALDPGPCGSRSACGAMVAQGPRKCHLSRPRP